MKALVPLSERSGQLIWAAVCFVYEDSYTFIGGMVGYADTARQSYAVFHRMRDERRVAPGTRFQVSIPTPLAPVVRFIRLKDVEAVLPAYARATKRKIAPICRDIPPSDLAIK